MTILVVGATGATGQLLVQQLINRGHEVRLVVRSPEKMPVFWTKNDAVTIIPAAISAVTEQEMSTYIADCEAVASCLGHHLSWKGIYGPPRRLVTDAIRLMCRAIQQHSPERPVRLLLMNTAGNRNRDQGESLSAGEKLMTGLIRLLLPPHADNEQAAEFLRKQIGSQNAAVQWVVVRPDTLIDQAEVSTYEVFPSPTRSALFNPGKTSRINVAHFMASLISDDDLWRQWAGQMPVIYNEDTGNTP